MKQSRLIRPIVVLPLVAAFALFAVESQAAPGGTGRDTDSVRISEITTQQGVQVDIQQGIAKDPVVQAGLGESLILLVGGTFATESEALQAAAATDTELEGLQVVPVTDFSIKHIYQNTAPNRAALVCSSAGMSQAARQGKIEQSNSAAMLRECRSAGMAGQSLDVVMDVRLQPDRDCDYIADCKRGFGNRADQWMIATAYRTLRGAQDHMTYLREMAGIDVVAVRAVRVNGTASIALGQEPHPDGSGPLLAPLENQLAYQ